MSDEQLNKDITNYTNWLSQFEDCPYCKGVGYFNTSDCCDASISGVDTICDLCDEHCELMKCDECNGTGTRKQPDEWDNYDG